MKQGDIYKSEGGYRVAWAMWGDSPVITNSPWYATHEEAEQAIKARKAADERQAAIDKAIQYGDMADLDILDPKTAKALRAAGIA